VTADPFTRELLFQAVDYYDYDAAIKNPDDDDDDHMAGNGGKTFKRQPPKTYNIRIFGITDAGESISVLV
jgi:hypothetical protein